MKKNAIFTTAKNIFLCFAFSGSFSFCTHKDSDESIKEPIETHKVQAIQANPVSETKEMKLPAQLKHELECNSTESIFQVDNEALWLKEHGLAITQFTKPCKTAEGKKGFSKDSSLTAMGFPCSFHSGKINISGNQWSPKMISFVLATSCPLKEPKDLELAKLKTALALSESSKVLAVHPFALQYWEAKGLTDADVGFSIDLRSVLARQHVWRKFTEGEPIPVRLFGRENSWGASNNMYEAQALIVYQAPMKFRLDVKAVKLLKQEEIEAAHLRCKKLIPRRRCENVF